MPVEFALRPRIRLREEPAPARRARARLPKFALPALTYWLVIGGLVYEFVRHHDLIARPSETEAALVPLPAAPPEVRPWWRPLPARPAPAPPPPEAAEPPALEPSFEAPIAPPEIQAAIPEPEPQLAVAEPPALELPLRSEPALRAPAKHAQPRNAAPELAPASAPALARSPTPVKEREPARDLVPSPTSTLPDPPRPAYASALPSCESALASASQDIDFSGNNRAADLPTQAIAAVLENGAWLASCAVPEHTALDVCVAIKGGHVVGASVTARPADAALSACVRRRASSLQFPYSPHLDVARTRF